MAKKWRDIKSYHVNTNPRSGLHAIHDENELSASGIDIHRDLNPVF